MCTVLRMISFDLISCICFDICGGTKRSLMFLFSDLRRDECALRLSFFNDIETLSNIRNYRSLSRYLPVLSSFVLAIAFAHLPIFAKLL